MVADTIFINDSTYIKMKKKKKGAQRRQINSRVLMMSLLEGYQADCCDQRSARPHCCTCIPRSKGKTPSDMKQSQDDEQASE